MKLFPDAALRPPTLHQPSACLLVALLGLGALLSPSAWAGPSADGDPAAFAAALRAAVAEPSPYHLRVDCTGDRGPRQLEVFPSGAALWNDRAQVSLAPAERTELLEILEGRGFAALEARYGGKPEATSERQPDGGELAALRVSCRVDLRLQAPPSEGETRPGRTDSSVSHSSVSHSSVQLHQGEQSAELAALAHALLDRVEPIARDRGLTAADLAQALELLAEGRLLPETLRLRWVELPASGSDDPGHILQVDDGQVSVQPYAPGQPLGEPRVTPLTADEASSLARQLGASSFPTLPVNLRAPSPIELEVTVLGHRKAVIARDFQRSGEGLEEAQARFARVLEALEGLRRELAGEGASPAAP